MMEAKAIIVMKMFAVTVMCKWCTEA